MRERLAILLHAVSVRRGHKWVLRDICWRLRPGQRWALLGDNGAGKTQLLKLLSGEVWPTPGKERAARSPRAHDSGRMYRVGRQPLDLIEAKPRVAYVGAELQDKYARYGWNLRVRDLVARTASHGPLLGPSRRGGHARGGALRACGLPSRRPQFLTLSYGQKRLALLARWFNVRTGCARRSLQSTLLIDVRMVKSRGAPGAQSWVVSAHRAAMPRELAAPELADPEVRRQAGACSGSRAAQQAGREEQGAVRC